MGGVRVPITVEAPRQPGLAATLQAVQRRRSNADAVVRKPLKKKSSRQRLKTFNVEIQCEAPASKEHSHIAQNKIEFEFKWHSCRLFMNIDKTAASNTNNATIINITNKDFSHTFHELPQPGVFCMYHFSAILMNQPARKLVWQLFVYVICERFIRK